MTDHRLSRLAADFWEESGQKDGYPRDLEIAILASKPCVAIIPVLNLSPAALNAYLASRGHQVMLQTFERNLNGCFYASGGIAFIFVEKSLSCECARLVIAHEFAHFLAHYEAPRRRAARRLGPTVLAVLDGRRRSTAGEELSASLAGVTIDSYLHFMERKHDGTLPEPISQAEQIADELGMELLAPWHAVSAVMQKEHCWPGQVAEWHDALVARFGFPSRWATPYAQRLRKMAFGQLPFSQALGL